MNKFIFIIALLSNTCTYSSISYLKATYIFQKIENTAGVHTFLHLDPTLEINAYSTYKGVYINQGLLNFVNREAELAMILGHELAHYNNQDYRAVVDIPYFELAADRDGYYYCKKLYKAHCLDFLYRMRAKYGEEGGDGAHPTWTYRINKLLGQKNE